MFRLIKAYFASAGKLDLRHRTPSCFLNFREFNTLLRERSHLGFQVVAHEIEFMRTILSRRVERGFSRRQAEDQPPVARIHRLESENIAEKCPVRFVVFTVDNHVSARDHLPPEKSWNPIVPKPWERRNTTNISSATLLVTLSRLGNFSLRSEFVNNYGQNARKSCTGNCRRYSHSRCKLIDFVLTDQSLHLLRRDRLIRSCTHPGLEDVANALRFSVIHKARQSRVIAEHLHSRLY